MKPFQTPEFRAIAQHHLEVGDDLVFLLRLMFFAEGLTLVYAFENLDDQHGVGGYHGAT